jgi:hypothetical protein
MIERDMLIPFRSVLRRRLIHSLSKILLQFAPISECDDMRAASWLIIGHLARQVFPRGETRRTLILPPQSWRAARRWRRESKISPCGRPSYCGLVSDLEAISPKHKSKDIGVRHSTSATAQNLRSLKKLLRKNPSKTCFQIKICFGLQHFE